MVKFATFEKTVEYIYKKVLGKPKEAYNAFQQTGVSFLGGYIAGVGCAVCSHPADVMVSKLNADRKGMLSSSSSSSSSSSIDLPFKILPMKSQNTDQPIAGEAATAAMSRIYRNIGFAGLWNGLSVRILMIGTLTAFQWLIYDTFKVALGVSLSSSFFFSREEIMV